MLQSCATENQSLGINGYREVYNKMAAIFRHVCQSIDFVNSSLFMPEKF